MKIFNVTDPEFAPYGKVLPGYDTAELLRTLEEVTPLPEGVAQVPLSADRHLHGLPLRQHAQLQAVL